MSTYTAPGVYIVELPSGSRSLTGVSTSLTAFVGAAKRGPSNRPTRIFGFADFEREFGGLWTNSPMSQAARQYFQNGGAEALIVRVVNAGDTDPAVASTGSLSTASSRMLVQATSAALGLSNFDHLNLAVSNVVGTTFDLTISARDANEVVLSKDAKDYAVTVKVDAASPADTIAAAIVGAKTPTTPAIALAELALDPNGDPMAPTAPPTTSPVQTVKIGGIHYAGLSTVVPGSIQLTAANEGEWGDRVRASVSIVDALPGAAHLTLTEVDGSGNTIASEVFYNVTTGATDVRALDQILARESKLARVTSGMGGQPLAASSTVSLTSGDDGAAPRVQDLQGSKAERTGIYALLDADLFNILCIPRTGWQLNDAGDVALWSAAETLCEDERAVLLIDPPDEWTSFAAASSDAPSLSFRSDNAALYFPRIRAADPLQEGRLREFPPCGAVAGVLARTDAARGVWKAPAGTEANLMGVPELSLKLSDPQQGVLNGLGVNCLRSFPVYGNVVWGSRTLRGADALASQWKYLSVRRLALYLEESLYRGLQWAVFEPNDEPLWGQIRQTVRGFLQGLYRQGAFAGTSPRQAYFVKCDRETTTAADVERGVVNIVVGYAPVRPAEFVIIKLQQLAGQASG